MQGYERGRSSSAPWGLVLAIGVIAAIFGAIVAFNPFDSLETVVALIGVFLIVAGIVGMIAGRGRGAAGFSGPIVAVVGGVILLVLPGLTLKLAAVAVGVILLVWGVVTALAAWRERDRGAGGALAGGVVLGVIGLVVIVWPGPTLSLLTFLFGLAVLIFGIGMIVQGIRMRT